MRIDGAIGQLDVNCHVRVLVLRLGDPASVLQHIPLVCLEDHIDRILADDGCKFPGRGLDQIALRKSGKFRIRPLMGERISV